MWLPKLFEIEVDSTGATGLMRLRGEFDFAAHRYFEGAFDRELRRLQATDSPTLKIDLADVTFLDSTGLRMLLMASSRAHAVGITLSIAPGGSEQVNRVLGVTGTSSILPLERASAPRPPDQG